MAHASTSCRARGRDSALYLQPSRPIGSLPGAGRNPTVVSFRNVRYRVLGVWVEGAWLNPDARRSWQPSGSTQVVRSRFRRVEYGIWSSWSRIRRWLLRGTIVGGAKR